MRASVHERSAPKWPGKSCSCTPSAYVEEVEPKSPRLREQNREFSDRGANDACDAPRATTQIYCRRARASTTTPVPKDLYHSRKMPTRRCDFRHQPSAGCTCSSSTVLRTTGKGGQLRTCNQGATHSRKGQFELRAWLATGSYLTRRVRAYDPLSDLAQKDVGYGDYIHRQGRPNMPSRAHRYSLQSALITQPPSGCRAWQLQLGGLLDCGHWLSPAPFIRQSGSVHISMWAGLGRPVAGAWQAKCAGGLSPGPSFLQTIWSASTCSMRMPSVDLGEDHAEGQDP